MKKCTETVSGKHKFDEAMTESIFEGNDDYTDGITTRTFLPVCIYCDLVDDTKEPRFETKHETFTGDWG